MIKSQEKKTPPKVTTTILNYPSITTTGFVTPIVLPTTIGGAVTQRIGDEIFVDRMDFDFLFYYGDVVNVIRVIVGQIVGNQTPLLVADVLANGPTGFPDVQSLYVPFMINERFRILSDRTIPLISTGSNGVVSWKPRIRPSIKSMTFVNGGTVVQRGQPFVLFISDSGAVIHPTAGMMVQTWFHDT